MTGQYPDHPRVAVGGVVFKHGCVLLVRRGKPPAMGEWAIPGGGVELGESLREAVEREIREETGIRVRAGEFCHLFEDIRKDRHGRVEFHYVIVDFLAEHVSGEPEPKSDALAASWITAEELPGLTVNRNTRILLKKLHFLD